MLFETIPAKPDMIGAKIALNQVFFLVFSV